MLPGTPLGLLTPYTGVAFTGSGEIWRAGARWKSGAEAEVSLEASLTEPGGGAGRLVPGNRRRRIRTLNMDGETKLIITLIVVAVALVSAVAWLIFSIFSHLG